MVYRKDIDVVIGGAGIVGCLAARGLARAGLSVLVVERSVDHRHGASVAAAGMLAPQMETAEGLLAGTAEAEHAMLALCLAARERFPGIIEALADETGIRPDYRAEGTLVVALGEERASDLARRAEAQRDIGLNAVFLSADQARALEPALSTEVRGALHLDADHRIDNVAMLRAAVASASRAGVRFAYETSIARVETAAGRVATVQLRHTTAGARHQPVATVVIAAGAWSGEIAGLPAPLPVYPVKGQIVAVDGGPLGLSHTVGGPGAYIVPRSDGRILIGATVEHAGFDRTVDPETTRALIAAAAAYVPALGAAARVEAWAGLRPGTPDELPILGSDPDIDGIVYATGHYRNGILLAPLTAEIVTAIVLGDTPPVDLEPFRRDRGFAPAPGAKNGAVDG